MIGYIASVAIGYFIGITTIAILATNQYEKGAQDERARMNQEVVLKQ